MLPTEVKKDIQALMRAARLKEMIRFEGKVFWEEESREEAYSKRLHRGRPRLESVAEHSWHVADWTLVVAPRFDEIDTFRCVALAVLHDKLEIWARDVSPLGRDGSGKNTFAFSKAKREERNFTESEAMKTYLRTLSRATRRMQEPLLEDLLEHRSLEAKFVRAVDKLQVFSYLIARKSGDMDNKHIAFNIRYAGKCVEPVDFLLPYYELLVEMLLTKVAKFRRTDVESVRREVAPLATELPNFPELGLEYFE